MTVSAHATRTNEQHAQLASTSPATILLTVDQAAQRLGTSVRFVRRLRAERRLAFVKLGKHLRVDSADLEAFIDAHREQPMGWAS
jgi:excisionase family DNA binding protein